MRVPALGLSSLRLVRLSPDSADGTHIPIAKMLVVEPGNLSLDKCEYLGTRPSDDVISELSRALRNDPVGMQGSIEGIINWDQELARCALSSWEVEVITSPLSLSDVLTPSSVIQLKIWFLVLQRKQGN